MNSDGSGGIGWEDLFGGGDQDFNDAILNITVKSIASVEVGTAEEESNTGTAIADDFAGISSVGASNNDDMEMVAMFDEQGGIGWQDVVDEDSQDGSVMAPIEGDNGWVEATLKETYDQQGVGKWDNDYTDDPLNDMDDDALYHQDSQSDNYDGNVLEPVL